MLSFNIENIHIKRLVFNDITLQVKHSSFLFIQDHEQNTNYFYEILENLASTVTYLNSPDSGVSMTMGSAVPSLWLTVTVTPDNLGLILPVIKIPLFPTNLTASPGHVSTINITVI